MVPVKKQNKNVVQKKNKIKQNILKINLNFTKELY